jgi:hypothetical protein
MRIQLVDKTDKATNVTAAADHWHPEEELHKPLQPWIQSFHLWVNWCASQIHRSRGWLWAVQDIVSLSFLTILEQDLIEFSSYVFQLLALILESQQRNILKQNIMDGVCTVILVSLSVIPNRKQTSHRQLVTWCQLTQRVFELLHFQ